MRVFLSNLGCKLNQAEVDSMARQFQARGYTVVPSLREADLHVVNSCTVTHAAARDSRKLIRRGRRLRPGLKTVVTGCWATDSLQEAKALEGVDLVVDNARKEDLVDEVQRHFGETGGAPGEMGIPVSFVPLAFGPTRGLVKVEDGCNMSCAFCIIPSTRGRQRSRPVSEVVREVRSLVAGGYEEIVVTGVQISSYRHAEAGLVELVAAILDGTRVSRLRLTSIAPWEFDRRLLPFLNQPRLCRHLHFSLQSGCRATLRRMRRPYTPETFRQLATLVRREVPGLALTTDVIVGFPGESDEEFEESLRFVTEMEFAKTHVFRYSERPGTAAAALPDPVAAAVRKQRVRRMLEVAEGSESRFRLRNLDTEATVLWEERRDDGWRGMTDNYIRVVGESETDLTGRLTAARLSALRPDGMVATPATLPRHSELEQGPGGRESGRELLTYPY